MSGKFRNVCFTMFDFKINELQEKLQEACTYYVIGKERCPNTGKRHLQGYCEFKNPRKPKKVLGECHFETRKGTAEEAANYCKKEENFLEWGTISRQGTRSDIDTVRDWVNKGETMHYITQNATSYQSMKCAELIHKYIKPKSRNPRVWWIYGPSGTGKTELAYELAGEEAYCYGDTGDFWDGYQGETNIIFDDLRPNDIKFNVLLRLLGKFPARVNVKGTSMAFKGETICITAPFHWKYYVPGNEDPYQLERRIIITYKTKKGEKPIICGTEVEGNTKASTSDKFDADGTFQI